MMLPVVNLAFSNISVLLNMIFPLLIYPYLARVLGPENMGIYSYFGSIISYGMLITSLGVGVYGVKKIGEYKDDDVKRKEVIADLIIINLIFAVMGFLAIIIAILLESNANYLIPTIMSLQIVTSAISCEWYFVGVENQKYIVIRTFIAKILTLVLIFIFIKSRSDLITYVIIVASITVAQHIYNYISLRRDERNINFHISKRIITHIYYMLKTFLVEIMVRYFGLVDVIILGILSTKTNVAYYVLALNVFNSVVSVMKVSATTLLPRMAFYILKKDKENIKVMLNKTSDMLYFIGIPAAIFCYIWAKPIINLLGGSEFNSSVNALQYLAILIIPSVITNMLVFQFFYPNGNTKLLVIAYSISIIVNVILNVILIPKMGFQSLTVASFCSNIIVLALMYCNNSKIAIYIFTKNTSKYVVVGIILLVIEIILNNYITIYYLPIHLLICLICYYFGLKLLREDSILPIVTVKLNKIFSRKVK